jgi:hypothetical protein
MEAAAHNHFESLVFAAGMTAFTDDCDRIVLRRLPSQTPVEPTLLDDSDFLPPAYGE